MAAAQYAGQDGGNKTPTPGQAQTPKGQLGGMARYETFRDKERKIGHRRVDEGGAVTYKKVSSENYSLCTVCGEIYLGWMNMGGVLVVERGRYCSLSEIQRQKENWRTRLIYESRNIWLQQDWVPS